MDLKARWKERVRPDTKTTLRHGWRQAPESEQQHRGVLVDQVEATALAIIESSDYGTRVKVANDPKLSDSGGLA